MNPRYKLILVGKDIYKEINLSSDMQELRIGTLAEADIRLRRDSFFSSIDLKLKKTGQNWNISCSDSLYLTTGGAIKFFTKKLTHGDEFYLRYQDSDITIFNIYFVLDFEYEVNDYNCTCAIGKLGRIKIGGSPDCDILINSSHVGDDFFFIASGKEGISIEEGKCKYGVYVNGTRIRKERIINDYDFFSIAEFSFFYCHGSLYFSEENEIASKSIEIRKVDNQSTSFKYPKFNRSTRLKFKQLDTEIEIKQAEQKPAKNKKNLLMSLIPALVMLVATIILRGLMSNNGGTFVIYSVVTMSMGIIMSIVTYFQEKKNFKKDWQKRIDRYNEYIKGKTKEIETARAEEKRILNLIYTSIEDDVSEAITFDKRLFERKPDDPDFLGVFLGTGTIVSSNQVKYTKQDFVDTEDPLSTIPAEVSEQFRFIDNAPIVSNFLNANGIGIVGDRENTDIILKNIILDVSVRHFYNDVKMMLITDSSYMNLMSWVRWLPSFVDHADNSRSIAYDEDSKNGLLENLYTLFAADEQSTPGSTRKIDSYTIVFVTDLDFVASHPISRYFTCASEYGVTFVFISNLEENLPLGCSDIIRVSSNNSGECVNTLDADHPQKFQFSVADDRIAKAVALRLGGIEIEEVALENELTSNITMFELLNILSVSDLDLSKRWSDSQVYKSLAAPLGVKRGNEVVYLDIGDKGTAHGPHGLVAGTTGSGKSEVLQTYILSIATLFHPYEVGFVVIDFKGGGMANQFKQLPHLIGTITNIDGREINRSLSSIKAELVKRQELFAHAGVNHINDYIKKFKDNQVTTPLPHLIMIVDEFAELKAEYPDFMKELISAARIGRTLGVHLILATQKPAGVVDAQIWSNSKFKICLKVQTKEDSKEVIKTPLAAEIVEPGRAYFQVGNNEIFDLFQSAYSGAKVPAGNDSKEQIIEINELDFAGRKTVRFSNKNKKSKDTSETQLDAIVDYVARYCSNMGIKRLPGICLPPLPDKLSVDMLNESCDMTYGIEIPYGLYDDPDNQKQAPLTVNFAKNNIYIVGSSQMGKTILLETMLYGLIRNYSVAEVNMYIVDCGSMVLKMFERSKHVGGIVFANEDEKCKNLFKYITKTIALRKKKLSDYGAGNYAAYVEAGEKDIPLMVLVIDNIAAFKEYYPDEAENLQTIAREAQGVGISLVFTATQSNALNYKILSNFGVQIALTCNDTNEYSNIFGHCKQEPKNIPGRGLVMLDKKIVEFQTAIFGESQTEVGRSDEMKSFVEARNIDMKSIAPQIPMVPENLIFASAQKEFPDEFKKRRIIPIGMDFENILINSINFNRDGFICAVGEKQKRDLLVSNLMYALSKTIIYHTIEICLVDDKEKCLESASSYGFVSEYVTERAEAQEKIMEFCDAILEADDDLSDDDALDDTMKVLIVNNADVFNKIAMDRDDGKRLASALRGAVAEGAFIIISCIENQNIGFGAAEALKLLKDSRRGIVFAPLKETRFFELSGRTPAETFFDEYSCYRFDGSGSVKVKLFNERRA